RGGPAPPARWLKPSWWRQRFLLQSGCAARLPVAKPAALKQLGARKLADDDRIETGIANQSRRDLHAVLIVTGNRHREFWIGPVRFAGEYPVGHRVEGANEPRSRQVFLRGHTDAVGFALIGDRAIARCNGIAGVEDDVAFESRRMLLSNLRYRSVAHGQQHNIGEYDRLIDILGVGQRAKTCNQVF